MRIAAALVFFASLLAGCGGGGGGAELSTPPAPPPGGTHGDATLNYTQTATATSTGAAPLAPGFTCVSPQTVRSASANASVTQTFAGNQTFMGRSGLTAITSVVALQSCADGSESYTETDYFAQQGSAPALLSLVGSTLDYSSYIGAPRSVTVQYGDQGLVVAELPLRAGQSWSSTAARSITSTWGSQYALNVNADGSYSENSVTTHGIFPYDSLASVERSDGSGSRTEIAGNDASAPPYVVTWTAPSANAVVFSTSGTAPVPPDWPPPIPCPTAGGTPCPNVTVTPYPQYAWYPYDPSPAKPLETIRSTDKGVASLPASCGVATNLPSSAELIETVDSVLDVTSGTTRTISDAYVDAQKGLLCLIVSMQSADYVFGPTSADATPVAIGTLTFTESLQSESAPPSVLAIPTLARLVTFYR